MTSSAEKFPQAIFWVSELFMKEREREENYHSKVYERNIACLFLNHYSL